MTWFRAGGGGIPASLKNVMNAVLNKKFGTSGETYAPNDWPDDVNLLGKLPEKTASGAIANITDGADEVPIKALSCSIVPQGGNGTPSSPVPITGTSKIALTHTKKNILQPSSTDYSNTLNGITGSYDASTGLISISGENESSSAFVLISFRYSNLAQKALKDVTYTFSHNLPVNTYAQITYRKKGTLANTTLAYVNGRGEKNSLTFALPSDFYDINFVQIGVSASATEIDASNLYLMLEVGSTASDYEKYDADTYEIDMPVGKNLLPNDLTTQTVNGTTFTVNADKSITISGTPSATTRVYITTEAINIETGSFFSFGTMPTGTRVFCSRTSGGSTTYPTISPSHTATIGAEYTNFLLEVTTSFDGTAFTIYPMLEIGSTATSYVPYKTVFGGTYEEDGTLIDGWATKTFDGSSDENWTLSMSAGTYRYALNYLNDAEIDHVGRDYIVANIGVYSASVNTEGTCFRYSGTGNYCQLYYIPPQTITTVEDFRDWLANNNLTVCYPLATPTEVQIDPLPQINTHLGVNNFWTDVDGGETELTYRADIDLALAQLSGTRGLMMASRSVSPMIGEEASLDRENILEAEDLSENLDSREEVSENSDNDESEEER